VIDGRADSRYLYPGRQRLSIASRRELPPHPDDCPGFSTLAVIQTVQDRRVLAITSINDFKLASAARVGDMRVRSIEWADDEHLLLTTASNQMPMRLSGECTEWHLMAVYDLKTNKLRGLLDRVRTDTPTMNVVYGRPVIQHKDNATLLYIHGVYVGETTEMALFRVNLTTGAEQLVKRGSGRPMNGRSTIRATSLRNGTTLKTIDGGRSGCSTAVMRVKRSPGLRPSMRPTSWA